jgi:hypothetical protein
MSLSKDLFVPAGQPEDPEAGDDEQGQPHGPAARVCPARPAPSTADGLHMQTRL